jgi:catechol 2,3-dioxygenase-like lactoylglutathione lyase family enzyme
VDTTAEHLFAGIPVADLARARDHYERLTGRPPDLIPNEHEAAWQLTPTGWIYVVVDAERAGRALNTVLIDDLDRFLAELSERGVLAGPVRDVTEGVRESIVEDPDGNRLKVGQVGARG